MSARRHCARGVSLIEALVALGVMAFGMLAVLGLQSTLRGNADVARQRAEAVRIAQESIEDWRAFGAIETTNGIVDYAEIVSDGPTDIAGVNATYARLRIVTASDSPPMKSLVVTVTWRDRTDEEQTVTLRTAIAAVPQSWPARCSSGRMARRRAAWSGDHAGGTRASRCRPRTWTTARACSSRRSPAAARWPGCSTT